MHPMSIYLCVLKYNQQRSQQSLYEKFHDKINLDSNNAHININRKSLNQLSRYLYFFSILQNNPKKADAWVLHYNSCCCTISSDYCRATVKYRIGHGVGSRCACTVPARPPCHRTKTIQSIQPAHINHLIIAHSFINDFFSILQPFLFNIMLNI